MQGKAYGGRMGYAELFLIAVGLSMDAFAVSLCKGLAMGRLNTKGALVIASFFGGFQALGPLVGWLLGRQFEKYITSLDHWVAFALLAIIGGKMLFEAFRKTADEQDCISRLDLRELLALSIATSIDAFAAGITFAFLGVDILPAISIIGLTTFIISFSGVAIGRKFGEKFRKTAEVVGGSVLIFIGFKILIEHLLA